MVIADRISDKPLNTKNKPEKHGRRKSDRAAEGWDSSDPIQLRYDEMISRLKLPAGWDFWGHYYRKLCIPGHPKIILRVQRIAREKEEGGYETHAIMCQEGIPYLANTVDFFLELMRESEECAPEEINELEDKEKSYFQWLKAKMSKEKNLLDKLNLSLKDTAEEISAAFINQFLRQFFQNSRLKIRFLANIPT